MRYNGQALCAVRNEDKSFRTAKKFSEWRMGVGAVLCARSERSGDRVHGTGAERLPVAAAIRRFAPHGACPLAGRLSLDYFS